MKPKPIEQEILLKCATEGFEDATAELEAMAEVYDGFPSQVVVKNCHDCHINIYPSQVRMVGESE